MDSISESNKRLDAIKFTCYNAKEIRNISVKEITNPRSLDSLLNPTENGLYDPVLGPATRLDMCKTCGLSSSRCPGHLGHIELPLPVYHPLFFKTMFFLLKSTCFKCHRLMFDRKRLTLMTYKLKALNDGLYHLLDELDSVFQFVEGEAPEEVARMSKSEFLEIELQKVYNEALYEHRRKGAEMEYCTKNMTDLRKDIVKDFQKAPRRVKCNLCGATTSVIRMESNNKVFRIETDEKTNETSQHYMNPIEVREHLSELWKNDRMVIENVFGAFHDASVEDEDKNAGQEQDPKRSSPSAIDILFLTVLAVPAPRYRPTMMVKGMTYENAQTSIYSKIILDSLLLRTLATSMNDGDDKMDEIDRTEGVSAVGKTNMWKRGNDPELSDKSMLMLAAIAGKTKAEKIHTCWIRLQRHIDSIFDSETVMKAAEQASEKCPGIKQKLEKKQGLFRQNMMGKRVNYAARSVISPDPYIATNEIGLPLYFATNLTYPTPVTPWNFKKLKQCVINGPNVYPGASSVKRADGTFVKLKGDDLSQRQALAKQLFSQQSVSKKRKTGLGNTQVVYRHVQNGDVMMVNRQPTLHKGSMMAHKVRVLPGEKTLRLHYANCKSYNADFDGDEMNAHFPQSELSRAEAYNLMSTNSQYLSSKDGTPLSGLIQDHMVAAVHMSVRGRFFTREQYQQLCFNALTHVRRKIKLLPPTMLKPEKCWTGKQVISTILLNIVPVGSPLLNLQGSSKIKSGDWEIDDYKTSGRGLNAMCESLVIIRQCELLCGVMDKNHCGNSPYGLVHSMYELYGCQYSGELLTCLARVFTAFLQQYRGFTLGVEDILVTEEADELRTNVVRDTLNDGQVDVANALDMRDPADMQEIESRMEKAHALKVIKKEDKLATVDRAMKKASNNVNDQIARHCTGDGLLKVFPNNNLQLMVKAGAKGGQVNCMQISCLLGQIELEGRRPPLMASGRSVPSFQPYDISLRAGGFISQRFLTGIRPQEYFFHCMAGREGLVDTAVKTSRSGYLQRCLVKHLEGIVLAYDMTVRDSDGSVMQFMYGEDGIDICKEPYLHLKQERFLIDNFKAEKLLLPSMDVIENSAINTKTAEKTWRKFSRTSKRKSKMEKKIRKERGEVGRRNSPFLQYSWENKQLKNEQATLKWFTLSQEVKQSYKDNIDQLQVPMPINSQLRPDMYLGSVSEKFREDLETYLKSNPAELSEETSCDDDIPSLESLRSMMTLKYQRSLCQPGESVGLVAAQSIGEPSTQMTLNTFHFAGRGEMNVTLGIPRLREILMSAAQKVKTPHVIVPVLPEQKRRAERLQKKLSSVKLSEVLHQIHVKEHLDLDMDETGQRSRKSEIKIELLPEKQFKKELALKRKSVLCFMEDRFFGNLVVAIAHRLRQRREEEIVSTQSVGPGDSGLQHKGGDDDTLETPDVEVDGAQGEQDEAFDEDDAKRGKNREDFEEDEEDGDNIEGADEEQTNMLNESTENVENAETAEPAATSVDMKDVQTRINNVLLAGLGEIKILEYTFDHQNNGWCKIVIRMPLTTAQVNIVSVIETEAKKTFVRKVPGITRCMLQANHLIPDQLKFVTEGINFHKLFEYQEILDLRRLRCNCIHSVEKTYGIEAATRVVAKEVANVFDVYGIRVNPRHLSLVADYMCFSGTYSGFNRRALASCASPLQQMTFESTLSFLKDAALGGRWDALQSPSARIVAGEVVKNGSGYFSVGMDARKG